MRKLVVAICLLNVAVPIRDESREGEAKTRRKLKLQYPSINASQFANCIIYSSGLKETLLNSVKAACLAGLFLAGWGGGGLEFA